MDSVENDPKTTIVCRPGAFSDSVHAVSMRPIRMMVSDWDTIEDSKDVACQLPGTWVRHLSQYYNAAEAAPLLEEQRQGSR